MDSETISRHVARNPGKEEGYVKIMAGLAREIHEISDLYYFRTEDEEKLAEIKEKASIIGYARLIRKLRKKGMPTEKDGEKIKHCMDKIKEQTGKWNTLDVS